MNARLTMEREALQRTLDRSGHASLGRVTPDGRAYEVLFDVRTLIRGDGPIREEALIVPVLYQLAVDHPTTPPLVIAGRTDLFNIHVHDVRDGCPLPALAFVCLGLFQPALTVADWVVATFSVLAWARLAADHPLNPEAAAFARREMARRRFPIDARPFFDSLPGAPPATNESAAAGTPPGLRLRSLGGAR